MTSINKKLQQTSPAKQTKKTHVEKNAAAKKKVRAARTPEEIDEPLSPEAEARLSELVQRIVSLHRKSTGQVFELGECLAEAKSVQPQKRFGRWLKENCGYSVRSAWSFISVHEQLADHRERLEQHAIGTTALFELAKADPKQIEDVIQQFDDGKTLKPAEIKALVGGKKDEAPEGSDLRQQGGKSGLQKLCASKLKAGTAEFGRLTAAVLEAIEKAVAQYEGGKRIVMRTLADDVQTNARQASDMLLDIAVPLQRVDYNPLGNLSHVTLDRDTGWGAVQHCLYRLGGAGSWPVRDEMEKWVIEVAHPALRFAVHGEPYVISAKLPAAPVLDIANAESNVTKQDQTAVEQKEDTDETTSSGSDAELDTTLSTLTATNKAPAEARMAR